MNLSRESPNQIRHHITLRGTHTKGTTPRALAKDLIFKNKDKIIHSGHGDPA